MTKSNQTSPGDLARALNHQHSSALCSERLIIDLHSAINSINGVPEWVQLLNDDEAVTGRDGRAWVNDAPEAILTYFNQNLSTGLKLVFDWEHATEIKAGNGDPAPAAAWGTEMEIRNQREIWVKLDWTSSGSWSVESREYRYLSPVILYLKESRQIRGITSVGLTNRPNLTIAALNQQNGTQNEEPNMTLAEALCQALDLAAGTQDDDLLAKVKSNKESLSTALNQATNPSLEQFVPRSDYDTALERASNAEQSLSAIKKESAKVEIETAINQALEDKKISPASVEYHTASCQQKGGLKRFAEFVKTALPVLGDASNLDDKKTGEAGTALNAQQEQMAQAFGNSAEELEKHG